MNGSVLNVLPLELLLPLVMPPSQAGSSEGELRPRECGTGGPGLVGAPPPPQAGSATGKHRGSIVSLSGSAGARKGASGLVRDLAGLSGRAAQTLGRAPLLG